MVFGSIKNIRHTKHEQQSEIRFEFGKKEKNADKRIKHVINKSPENIFNNSINVSRKKKKKKQNRNK